MYTYDRGGIIEFIQLNSESFDKNKILKKYLKMERRQEMYKHNKKNYEMLSYIMSGKVRILIFLFLLNYPESYAYEISQKINVDISYISRSLKALEKKNILHCLNPESSRRKLYRLTSPALILKNDILKRFNR